MRELVLLVGLVALVVASAVAGEVAMRARRERRRGRPCDVCDRSTSPRYAHTHHHEDGCGIDDRARESCRCDPWRCPACCPCSIEALLSPRVAP